MQAIIDADRSVRELTVKVDVIIEEEEPDGEKWFTITERRFSPNQAMPWPLSLAIPLNKLPHPGRFQLTATARDANSAVLARARSIRTMPNRSSITTLRTHFDAACLHQSELCGDLTTCHAGTCVDAEDAEDPLPTSDEPEAGPAADGVTSVDPATKPRQETGKAVAPECVNRTATERFCNGDVMLVCSDASAPMVRPCGAHERCVGTGGDVRCDCSIGYVRDVAVCRAATSCDTDNGGCDPRTQCRASANAVSCGACPSGYSGDGKTGCRPLLTLLEVPGGVVKPALAPDVYEYRVQLPLLSARAMISAAGAAGTRVEFDTHPVPAGMSWLSPVLPVGETVVEIAVISESDVRSTYRLTLARDGAEVAHIKASNPSAYDYFGINVSRDGDTIVVSAPREDGNTNQVDGSESSEPLTDSGAAYVFVTDGMSWKQQAYLKPMDVSAGDMFGGQVAIAKDTIAVGAVRADIANSSRPQRKGVAYTFERENGTWSQRGVVSASDGVAGDLFGYSLVLDAQTMIVSAPRAGGGSSAVGTVYVFAKQNGSWLEVQKLRPSTAAAGGMFGSSLWLYPDMLFVGSEDEQGGAGAMYVFVRRGGAWVEQQRLAGDPARGDRTFGWAAAMRGDFLAIGASGSSEPTPVSPAGTVYLYKRQNDRWLATGTVQAPTPRTSDYFGAVLCATDHVLAIGASGDGSSSRGLGGDPRRTDARFAGAVYLYSRSDLPMSEPVYLKASNADSLDGFGYAMTCSENELVVTAPFEASGVGGINANPADNSATSCGAVYVIR